MRGFSIARWVLSAVMILTMRAGALPGQNAGAKKAGGGELRAAAGKVDITPTKTAFLAGYGFDRPSVDAHDRLMARCLVLESGGTRLAIVSCDLLGVPRYQIERIRALVKSIPAANLVLAATHTHSGPDTLGQWGPDLRTSGVDPVWMADFRQKVAQLVDTTSMRLQPAALRFATTTEVGRISKNIRVPRILDTELGVMQVLPKSGGQPIATLANYACHPEIMNTHRISADFPHWLYETVEAGGGGVCLYLNGAQGGMITADFDETTTPKGENWAEAERIGRTLGQRVLEITKNVAPLPTADIHVTRRVFLVPLENPRFRFLIGMKVFPKEMLVNGQIETEVSRVLIGPAEILTLPGEVLPNIGLYLKSRMQGRPKFLFGLTGDELGYILTPEDFVLPLYNYESSVSVGPEMEPRMVQNLRELMH